MEAWIGARVAVVGKGEGEEERVELEVERGERDREGEVEGDREGERGMRLWIVYIVIGDSDEWVVGVGGSGACVRSVSGIWMWMCVWMCVDGKLSKSE